MGKLSNPKLVSGQLRHPNLTNTISEKEYAKAKVHMWLYMLNGGQRPTKWLKPNSKGTKVNFDYIYTEEDFDKGLEELESFTNEMNSKYDLVYKFKKEA